MKRVCTLRKVLRSFFKGPLRKVIFYRSYIVAFCRHSVLVVYEYLQPGDMLWNGKVTLNICITEKFSLI